MKLSFVPSRFQCRPYFTRTKARPLDLLILKDQHEENITRIQKYEKALMFKNHNILIPNYEELQKCLYPFYFSWINCSMDSRILKYQNFQLAVLGKRLFKVSLHELLASSFKKTEYDINNVDFNYNAKLDRKLISSSYIRIQIRHFLRENRLQNIARFVEPINQVPSKVRIIYDERVFLTIIGFLSITNDTSKVKKLLNKTISKDIIRSIFFK